MKLKPNCASELTRKMEKDVLPLLRKSKGFQDEIVLVSSGGEKAFAISLWDRAENAETYNRDTYPQIVKMLETVTEGAPQIGTYEVTTSTFHKIAATVPA
jgi:hypothetical protein